MGGRAIFRVIAALLLVAVLAGIGVYVYNAGVAEGIDEGLRIAASADGEGANIVYPGYYHRPGFGFFGILLTILGIFLVFGLLRAAFFGGRWGGPGRGHWGPPGGPGRWGGGRREFLEEWHREAHGDAPRQSEERTAPGSAG